MRKIHLVRAGVLVLLFLLFGPTAAEAQTVSCVAAVNVTPTSEPSISGGPGLTVIKFDFTGTVEHCLADGTRVPGTIVGRAVQLIGADGSGTVIVRETVTIPSGSTLGFIVIARFDSSSFDGTVTTTSGTGELARVIGRGTFFPTGPPTGPVGPTSFLSMVVYEYF